MFAPGDRDLARNPAGQWAGLGSPELSALSAALTSLAEISDQVTRAVQRHDRRALEEQNARAEAVVAQVTQLATSLTADSRALVGETGIAVLCERLAVAARRNAYLIENAWAVDAALMRMLVGIGKIGADGAAAGYGSAPAPTYMDRQA